MRGQAGENLGDRKIVYWDNSGLWRLADADDVATQPTIGFTIGSIASGNFGRILLQGIIGKQGWTWTRGATLYASTVAGEITHTLPTTPDRGQRVGVAYDTDLVYFDPKGTDRNNVALTNTTRAEIKHLTAAALGRPNTNPPSIVQQDNTELLAFTVGTDQIYYGWEIPSDYAGGDLIINAHWTNDGGVDDNTKDIKLQIDYQSCDNGDAVSGNHANSPRTIEDTYASAAGWIIHTTGNITIPAADFTGEHIVAMKISFVAPAGAALTCDPHLISLMIEYTAYANQ